MPSDAMDQIAMHRQSNASPVLAPKRSKSHLKVSCHNTPNQADLGSSKKRMLYINTDMAIKPLHTIVDLINLQCPGTTRLMSDIHPSRKKTKTMKSHYHPRRQMPRTPMPVFIPRHTSTHIVKHHLCQPPPARLYEPV